MPRMFQAAFVSSRFRNRFGRVLAPLLALAVAHPVFAQFSISGTVGAQTLTNAIGTVTATGTISAGSNVGVNMTGNSTLTNHGTITTTSGRSIDSNATSNLTVTNTGLISSNTADAFRVNTAGSSVALTNSGTIRVTAGGQAIDWAAITTGTNTLTNLAGGVITAVGEDAVRPGQNGIINNAGTIGATPTGTTAPSGSDGIDLRTQKTVTVTNTGTIYGRHGIATDGANVGPSSLTVHNNAGTIYALNGSGLNVDGVSASVTANVTNAVGATIKGGVLAAATEGDGDGIDIDGVLTLNNSGDVLGLGAKGTTNNAEGIAAGGGSITNTATGRIIGSSLLADAPNGNAARGGNGILIDDSNGGNAVAPTTINNSGLIQGKSGFGVKLIGVFADMITNNAGGIIRGNAGAEAAVQTGDGGDVVTNSGTIQHDSGDTAVAIDLGAGSDTLNFNAGAISGWIRGGSGANLLNLGNGVSHGSVITDFQTINVAGGSAALAQIFNATTLTKVGAGTLNLTGQGSIAGGTTIATGTLLVNNGTGFATGASAVSVSLGATLGGAGTLGGPLTVNGILAPGNSIGTLTVANNVTWNGSLANAWQFELGVAGASDRLNVGGDFLKGTGFNFVFDFLGTGEAGTYVLVDWAGALSFLSTDFSYLNLTSGLAGTFAINGSQLEFTVAAIPEPSAYAAFIGAAALGFVTWRRRRVTV